MAARRSSSEQGHPSPDILHGTYCFRHRESRPRLYIAKDCILVNDKLQHGLEVSTPVAVGGLKIYSGSDAGACTHITHTHAQVEPSVPA